MSALDDVIQQVETAYALLRQGNAYWEVGEEHFNVADQILDGTISMLKALRSAVRKRDEDKHVSKHPHQQGEEDMTINAWEECPSDLDLGCSETPFACRARAVVMHKRDYARAACEKHAPRGALDCLVPREALRLVCLAAEGYRVPGPDRRRAVAKVRAFFGLDAATQALRVGAEIARGLDTDKPLEGLEIRVPKSEGKRGRH